MGAIISHKPEAFQHIRDEITSNLAHINAVKLVLVNDAVKAKASLQGDTYDKYIHGINILEESLDHKIQACHTLTDLTLEFEKNHMHAAQQSADDLAHAFAQINH